MVGPGAEIVLGVLGMPRVPGHVCCCGRSRVTGKVYAACGSEGRPRGCCWPAASPLSLLRGQGPRPAAAARVLRGHQGLRTPAWLAGRTQAEVQPPAGRGGAGAGAARAAVARVSLRSGEESGRHLSHPAVRSLLQCMASAQRPVRCLFHERPPEVCCHQGLSLLAGLCLVRC